jgi:hypothetical protein
MKTKHRHLKKSTLILNFAISFLILFSFNFQAGAIVITSPASPTCLAPSGVIGTPLDITLTTDVAATEWSYTPGNELNEVLTGVTLNITTGHITGTPLVEGEFIFQVIASDGMNISAAKTLKLCISRPAVDVMLVLDRSGSMSEIVAGGASTKYDVLKSSVQAFLEEYRLFGVTGDRLGVAYFDDNRYDFIAPGLQLFNSPPADPIPLIGVGSVQADMDTKGPLGWTCIGGGVLSGYTSFNALVTQRNLIIFSDGIQNRDPSFNEVTKIVSDQNIFTDGTGFPAGPLDLKAPPLSFKLHSIAIGNNAVTTLMQGLSTANNDVNMHGEYLLIDNTTDLVGQLDLFFNQAFVGSLANFSPAIVDARQINITGNPEIFTNSEFVVNNTADKIVIKVVGDASRIKGMQMVIKKGAVTFTNEIKYLGSNIMFLADKKLVESRGATMGGKWTLALRGRSNITVTATCIINDEYVNYNTSLGNVLIEPGDPLNLKLTVKVAGIPEIALAEATAFVLKPGQDVNDLFSNASNIDPPSGWTTEDSLSAGQDKYNKLIGLDSAFVNLLTPVQNLIALNNNNDGTYSAVFTNTEESGIYRVVFKFKGTNAKTGDFERYIIHTHVIDFGQPSTENTTFSVVSIAGTNSFNIIPKNKFGHLIGPDRLNQIQLLVDNKSVKLTDNLDGSYTAAVPSSGVFNTNPTVKLDIKGIDYTSLAGIKTYSDIEGANLNLWDKFKAWILLLILLIAAIIAWIRKKKQNP